MVPKPGDIVQVDTRASVQFDGNRAMTFRVTTICPKPTYHGWAWLTGYVLDQTGNAVERRTIFVQPAGLRPAHPRQAGALAPARRPVRRRGV